MLIDMQQDRAHLPSNCNYLGKRDLFFSIMLAGSLHYNPHRIGLVGSRDITCIYRHLRRTNIQANEGPVHVATSGAGHQEASNDA